jgi:hypothetical protein
MKSQVRKPEITARGEQITKGMPDYAAKTLRIENNDSCMLLPEFHKKKKLLSEGSENHIRLQCQ